MNDRIPDRPLQPPHVVYSAPEVDLADYMDLQSIGVPDRISKSIARLMQLRYEAQGWKRIGELNAPKVMDLYMKQVDALHKDLRVLCEEAQ